MCEFVCLICVYNHICFCLHRHVPNSVMSIDLSHHLDNADDNNAAAQLVSHFIFTNYFVKQT